MDSPVQGGLRVELGAEPALALQDGTPMALPPRDALLLARLLLDGAQTRAVLAAWLWPKAAPAGALANLRQRLKRLQDATGAALLQLDGSRVAIGPGVAPGFRPPLPLLPALGPQRPEAADAGIQTWLAAARRRLHRQQRQAALERLRELEDAQAHDAALPLAAGLVADDPDDAEALRRLMRLHHARGEPAQALRAYRAHQRHLRRQLDTEPDAATRALAHTIATAGAAPAGATAAPAAWLPPEHPRWALLSRPPRRVQRDAAWAQLQLVAQGGGVAWLLGPGGVGKSRLAHDFCEAHAVPLRLACRPGLQAVPYALLAAWVRGRLDAARALPAAARAELARLEPTLGDAAPGPLQPVLLLQALQALHAPAPCLTAVCIDDLHQADVASLELLPALLADVPCVLLSLRPDEAPPPLRAWLATDGDAGRPVERIELGAFGVDGVAALLADVGLPGMVPADWAPLLLGHTGGHPFLLLETLRALARGPRPAADEPPAQLPSPPRVRELLLQRLQALSPLARQLAELAALAGEHFSARLATVALGGVAQQAGAAWAELQGGGYLGATAFGQARLHDLVAEALRSAMPPPVAAQRHRQVATALKALGPVPAARLAHHWAEAGEPRRAARLHERAAQDAQRLSRVHEQVAELDRAALQWALAHEPARAFDARAQAAEVRITQQQLQEGLAQAQAMLDEAVGLAQQTAAQRLLALAHAYRYQHEPALRWATAAHAGARALGRADWQVDVAGLAAVGAASLGQSALAREWLQREAAVSAEQAGWRSDLNRHGTRCSALAGLGDTEAALAVLEKALALSNRPDMLAERAAHLANGATLAMKLGLEQQGLDYAVQAQALAQPLVAHDGVVTWINVEVNAALCRLMAGELDAARAGLERTLERARDPALSYWRVAIENHLMVLWLQLGHGARVLQVLQAGSSGLSPAHQMRRWALRVDLRRLCGTALPLPEPPPEAPADLGLRAVFLIARHGDDPPEPRARAMQALWAELTAQGLLGAATWAGLHALEAEWALNGEPGSARLGELSDQVAALWQQVQRRSCLAAYRPEMLLRVATLLAATGHTAAAAQARAEALAWVQRAEQRLRGTVWHEGFVQRNLVNAALLRPG